LIARLCASLALWACVLFAAQSASPPVYVVSGTAVDSETHAPLSETEVQIAPANQRDLIESVITGPDGRFSFNNLFAGKYALTAARPGYLSSTFQQHGRYSTGIVTGPNLPTTGLLLPLSRKCVISGIIVDQDGDPVPNARIEALRDAVVEGLRSVRAVGFGTTGADGRYRVSNLQPGSYYLALSAQPWYAQQYMAHQALKADAGATSSGQFDVAYPIVYYPGVTADASAEAIVLRNGAHAQADFTLTAVPAAHVTMSRTSGSHINLMMMAPTRWGVGIPVRSMFFSPLGRVFNVAPGKYQLIAGWRDTQGRHSANKIVDISGSTTIEPSSLESQRSIVVTLTGQGGFRPSAMDLRLRDLSTLRVYRPVLSGSGQMRWPAQELMSNRYEVLWTGEDGSYIESLTATNARVTGRIVELGPDATAQLHVTLAQGTSMMTGKVEQNGSPVAAAMVLLLPNDFGVAPSLIRRDQSDSDGTFLLQDIAPGSYTLLALPADDNLEYANPAVMQQYLAIGKKVTIAPSSRFSETIELQPAEPAAVASSEQRP
jgi:protocatechuate 3,4-dioxygenase beta subunit